MARKAENAPPQFLKIEIKFSFLSFFSRRRCALFWVSDFQVVIYFKFINYTLFRTGEITYFCVVQKFSECNKKKIRLSCWNFVGHDFFSS